jgi:outer membrane lipoprotein SlyB
MARITHGGSLARVMQREGLEGMMKTVAGIFDSRETAITGIEHLRGVGVREDSINALVPGTSAQDVSRRVPTDSGEQTGMGATLGAVVGGATGASIGLPIGAAVASFVIPGLGPIMAAGALGAAIFGAGGAAVGHALEENLTHGLSRDELIVYEDALRRGKIVVLVQARDDGEAEAARAAMASAGAESIDAAREAWWVGLRDDEARAYTRGDFARDEPAYRRGFEAALLPFVRGRGYDQALAELRRLYPDVCQDDAFRCGFERGQAWDAGRDRPEDKAA